MRNVKVKRFKKNLIYGAVLSVLVTPSISAEEDPDEIIETENTVVIVTARKKSENIIKIPMNISTVSEMEIADRNLLSKEDMFRSVAGAANPRGELILRGLSGSNDSTPETTSTFTDGVPFDFGDLYDVGRVEVLRGPQGTLYGSNAIGGTVRVITNKPKLNTLEIKTSLQINSETKIDGYDQRLFGAINMPLSDDFALRVTGSTGYDPKSITNINTAVQGYSQQSFLRAQLLWQAQDDLSINFSLVKEKKYQIGTDTADMARGGSGYEAILTANSTAPFGYDVELGSPDPDACDDFRPFCMSQGQGYIAGGLDPRYNSWELMDQTDETGTDMFMVNLVKDDFFGIGSLTYAGSYRDYIDRMGINSWSRSDGGDMFRTWLTNDWQRQRTTHEIRIQSKANSSNWDWTVGYFYDKDELGKGPNEQHQWHGDGDTGKAIATALWGDSWGYLAGGWTDLEGNYADITNVAELGLFYWGNPDINYSEKSLVDYATEQSLFGEISYVLETVDMGEFEFAGGIRLYDLEDHEVAEVKGIWGSTDDNGVHIVEVRDQGGSEDGNRIKFSSSWRPDDKNSVYALYSEGYRPGGNNIPNLPQSCRQDPNAQYYQSRYESDQIKNKELGYKTSRFNGAFSLSSAIYQIDWTGVQVDIRMGCGFGFTSNAAEARSRGLEIETNTRLTKDLTLTVNYGYTQSEMLSDVEQLDALAGDDMTQVPKYNAYLALDQGFTAFNRQAYVRLDVEAYGEYKTHFKAAEGDIISAYEKVNLSSRIELKDDINLSLHINNLFDKEIIDYKSSSGRSYGNFNLVQFSPGRNMTLRVNYNF